MKFPGVFVFILCFAVTTSASAQETMEENVIVIRHVVIPGIEANKQDAIVNIVIKNGILDIITADDIPLDDADETYDAAGGVVVGQLELGQQAGFIILRQDPRKNVQALLDTKKYASFAIYQGKVLKNNYTMIVVKTTKEKQKESQGWLAYTPPPLAKKSSYTDTSKWNRLETKYVTGIFAGAVVLDRQRWLKQDANSFSQLGVDLDEFSGGEVRGLRIGAVGTINFDKPWVWTIFGATHAFDKGFDQTESDDFTLFDVRLDIPVFDKVNLSFGKQKEPISMERTMSMVDLPMQERSAPSDALLPSRNVGIVGAGYIFNDRVSFAVGIFNNFLDKDQPNSMSDNATQFVARATWVPFMSENESTLLHLGLGYRYSDVKEGGSIRTEPEFNKSPNFVDTGFIDGTTTDDAKWYQFEASLRSGPFWLHSEYIRTNVDSTPLMNPTVEGYNVTFSWIATGEVRRYRKRNGTFSGVPISRSVKQNGWGAWEYGIRYSTLDMSDGLFDGGELDIWSASINWWLTPLFNVNLNYRYITLDQGGVTGHSSGINSRVLIILE